MSLFPLTFSMVDDFTRITTRSFKVEATDFAAAVVVVAAFLTDYQAATKCKVFQTRLMDETVVGGAPTADANVDAGMTISAQLETANKKAAIQVPDPVAAIIQGDGTIDIADAIMTALLVNYTQATSYITASDGEKVASWIKATLDK